MCIVSTRSASRNSRTVATPPPRRTSLPSAASFARRNASSGVASTKWNVVSDNANDGRTWCVSTNTGVWNGGSSPHQPFHFSSSHGPRCGPNLLRPMISAPMLWEKSRVRWSSRPRVPPGSVRFGQLAVAPAHDISAAGSAWPNGRSRLWCSPAPKPSRDTAKFWTFSSWVIRATPPAASAGRWSPLPDSRSRPRPPRSTRPAP